MEGLEKRILCQDDEDYDAMVKALCVCARRKNVIIIIYTVVSNHCHAAVLARNHSEAYGYGQEAKRMYAMWFRRKYGAANVMSGVDVKAISLDSDWYVRNALAYIPRNALDNGCNVNDYKWSGFSAMFRNAAALDGIPVKSLQKRQKRQLMHTGDDLKDVNWLLDVNGFLIPSSFCDYTYLEQAFNKDLTFFLKTIGSQNSAEMRRKLVSGPRTMMVDTEFLKVVNEISLRWFQVPVSDLSLDRKTRIMPYIYHTMKTTIPQLARAFSLDRQEVARILGKKMP